MTTYNTIAVNGLNIFYREAGSRSNPTILLLHGYPTSSFMFRNLISKLEDRYHLVAPDYPGFGQSSMPSVTEFEYSFDNLANVMEQFIDAIGLGKFSLYVMDYGAPVGYRIAARQPERIEGLLVQNGNAYREGMTDFWAPIFRYWEHPEDPANIDGVAVMLKPESTRWQYVNGVKDISKISPDTWLHDQALLDRPGNREIQLQLFLSYGTNPPLYPEWQAYFRKYQPPTLIIWGEHDDIFPASGAHPYKRDLRNIEFHLLDTGHFALEDHLDEIVSLIDGFLEKNVKRTTVPAL
ncbi:alpha/beta fold hydrolase [Chitinophaga barathri]|uniref:Alpha/beta hydrolase n=1 Tax=Chitinophaga barathri TaxID=1647451 RepID=A0A3N4N0I9_9BACT|nr:alpha/beta hydrolase [Chitinophaga barathri]RPD41143.1 alpha/beta hydrolase [Chitinophaga barathri]